MKRIPYIEPPEHLIERAQQAWIDLQIDVNAELSKMREPARTEDIELMLQLIISRYQPWMHLLTLMSLLNRIYEELAVAGGSSAPIVTSSAAVPRPPRRVRRP